MKNAQSVLSNGQTHKHSVCYSSSVVFGCRRPKVNRTFSIFWAASGRAHLLSWYIRQSVHTHTHTNTHTYTLDGQSDVPLLLWVAERGPTAFGKSVCTSNQCQQQPLLYDIRTCQKHTRKSLRLQFLQQKQ